MIDDIVLVLVLATPGNSQGLILALHKEITFHGAWGTIWGTWDQNPVGHMQGKYPTCCIIAPLNDDSFEILHYLWNMILTLKKV